MQRSNFMVICAIALASSRAYAAGYEVKEHSADAMATAYAGAAATGTDASYLAYNPASLADVNSFDISVSAVTILPQSTADYTLASTSFGTPLSGSHNPKAFVAGAIIPDFALRYRLSDRWAIGVSVSVPFGLKTKYPTDWAGRYYAERTEFMAIDAAPAISYQALPWLSLGGAVQIEYAKGTLTSAIDTGTIGAISAIPGSVPGAQDSQAKFTAESWSVGFTLGAMARINDRLRVGLSYRSPVHHALTGPLDFTLDGAGVGGVLRSATGLFTDTRAKADLTMPDEIELGARYIMSERWTALAELDWTNWSRFHELRVVAANPAQPDDVTAASWGAGWFGSLGADYRADDRWHLRAGLGYDSSPVPQSTLNPRMPDASRLWVSAGGRYAFSDTTTLNLTVGELFDSNETIARSPLQTGNSLRGALAGTTKSSVTVVGLEFSYRQL